MSDNPHESPHERIFLQYWMDEPSWCQDRIDGCVTGDDLSDEIDTEYIRVDVHDAEIDRLKIQQLGRMDPEKVQAIYAEKDAEIARLKADYARAEETLRIEIAETAAQRRRSNKAERDRDEARGAIKEVYWTAKASIEATHTSEWISPRFLVQLLEPFVMPNPTPEPETEE